MTSINDLWRYYHNKLDLGISLYWNYHDGCWTGCCKTYIEWALKVDDSALYDLCSKNCQEEWADPSLVNSMDLLDQPDKLSDLCFQCNVVISSFLINKLHTFIVSENNGSDDSES